MLCFHIIKIAKSIEVTALLGYHAPVVYGESAISTERHTSRREEIAIQHLSYESWTHSYQG